MKTNLITLTVLLIIGCNNSSTTTINEEMKEDKKAATLLLDVKNQLGEGAFWNYETQSFWWVDIEGRLLNMYDVNNAKHRKINLKERIGTVVPTNDGNAVVALENGIFILNLDTEELVLLSNPEEHLENIRLNDGKCDPAGRLWVGSMHLQQIENAASLYRIEHDGTHTQMLDSITISNGIIWSLDEKTMYYIDTHRGNVRAFDYEKATGDITNERVIIEVPDSLGYPDGMTIDEEGMLWIALWSGSCVSRWNPDTGELLETIAVPAKNVTACAFGGENLDKLYITSASIGMNENDSLQYPQAGGVFVADVGVKGVKSPFFGE